MSHTVALAIALAAPVALCGQHENDRWVFGGSPFPTNPPALNFFSGSPVPFPTVPTSSFWSTEASAAVADDVTGTLLFYTDANKVFTAQNNAMPNGGASFTTNLRGCVSSTQGALILPRPGLPGRYYIFTVDCSEDFPSPTYSGLMWSEVDMSLNGGFGDVIAATRNSPLWLGPGMNKLTEKLTATQHTNGTDYWVVVHEWTTNRFLSFQVSCAGISAVPVVSAVGTVHTSGSSFPEEVIGAMKISLTGTRLALVAGMGTMSIIEIFDFDPATGIVSNPITLPANGNDYGLEFSPNGQRLYTTQYNSIPCCSGKVFQYNLLAGNAAAINASKVQLANSSTVGYGGLQLGPDNKVHIARALQTNTLGVINTPNNLGGAAGFSNTGASLSSRRCNIGLPNLARFQTGPDCEVLLPVELIDFSGSCKNGVPVLRWATASEHNSDHFVVERSRDGIEWELVGQVTAQGNSSGTVDYEFIDRSGVVSSPIYYLLRQVDIDGMNEVLGVRSVQCADGSSLYYDAEHGELVIPGQGEPGLPRVTIYNGLGQMALMSTGRVINVDRLPAGSFVAVVVGSLNDQAVRFVKR